MRTIRRQFSGYAWLVIPFALAYGAFMLALQGEPLTHLYSESPYHRFQANALLHGHFYLGTSLEEVRPGLAWHDGKVQQVWGLGAGLWLVPFQALWGLCSGKAFPDRVGLGTAFALLGFYAGATGVRISRARGRVAGLGFVWLMLLFPPLCTLTRGCQLVFEETVLYGLLLCLGILTAVVRVAIFDTLPDYWLCCALAGFSGFVRPTHAVFGLGGVLASSLILWLRRRSLRPLVWGNLAFLAGLGLLGVTNWIRFGSPTEFGHRLTVSSGGMIYLTRFGNPYSRAGLLEAAKELFGALFLASGVQDLNAFYDGIFPWQGPFVRWRRLYLTTFDVSYVLICLAAVVVASLVIGRLRKAAYRKGLEPESAVVIGLLLWFGCSAAGLGAFYLRFPIMTSRYLLDFAPAFAACAVLLWLFFCSRWPLPSLAMLAVWLTYEILTAKIPPKMKQPIPRAESEPSVVGADALRLEEFRGTYTIGQHPASTGIPWNGRGWDPDTGFAEDILIMAVDRPVFVELNVAMRRGLYGQPPRKDVYAATLDGAVLPLRQILRHQDSFNVVFDLPHEARTASQKSLLCLCFSKSYDAEDRDSERILYLVRWH